MRLQDRSSWPLFKYVLIMILRFLVFALLYQRQLAIRGQSANSTEKSELSSSTCGVSEPNGKQPLKVAYNGTVLRCLQCQKHWTLVPRKYVAIRSRQEACKHVCFGVLCSIGYCLKADDWWNFVGGTELCITGKKVADAPVQYSQQFDIREDTKQENSRIPVIIGITVGGFITVAIAAGIFFRRYKRGDNRDSSEVVTSAVSLSKFEWQSNSGSAISRRKEENLRVEEASREDLTAPPLYALHGNEIASGIEYIHTTGDDASSFGEGSFRSSNTRIPAYYPSQLLDFPSQSNRSSDVILEDGYVTGGHFVGSDDPQIQALLYQNSGRSSNEMDEKQAFFGGQAPGSMTHDAICMSLTHSDDQHGVLEYVMEDQDLVLFSSPSLSMQDRTPPINGGIRVSQTSEDDIMQLSLHFADDADSDFEDRESRLNSDKSEVFFFSNTQSPGGEKEGSSKLERMRPASQCSESGIEVSYHSKDSSEIETSNRNSLSPNLQLTSISQKENYERSHNGHLSCKQAEKHDKFFAGGTTRSKSCSLKSPYTPTRFSSREQCIPTHCPSSAPEHFRPRERNLTHVFVDVHRSMTGSDEDLLSRGMSNRHCSTNHYVSDSHPSSFGIIPLSGPAPYHARFDVQYPLKEIPGLKSDTDSSKQIHSCYTESPLVVVGDVV